jgi:hypothetical protein
MDRLVFIMVRGEGRGSTTYLDTVRTGSPKTSVVPAFRSQQMVNDSTRLGCSERRDQRSKRYELSSM